MNTTDPTETTTRPATTHPAAATANWLVKLLVGCGLPGAIARIIAYSLAGAGIAIYTLTSSGCSASYSQTAAGDILYKGELIALPITPAEK